MIAFLKVFAAMVVLSGILSCAAVAQSPPDVDPVKGEVILFVHPDDSQRFADMTATHIPAIQSIAEQMGAKFRRIDVTHPPGVPEDAALTPLIVFQNYRGRSIFQGRYADHGKVEHFVRTSRFVAQGDAPNVKEDIPVMTMGRAMVGSPIKVTSLQYMIPDDHDEEAFHARALATIKKSFTDYEVLSTANFGRSDRLFYMDFYPFGIEDGQLVISLALFSQFNCHEPVYTEYTDQVIGPMSEADRLFAEATQLLEQEVKRQIAESTIGDGFAPIGSDVSVVSWEELGLALPDPPETNNENIPTDLKLGRDWTIAEGETIDGAPLLQFRFPAPLDNYAGSASEISGTLNLAEGNKLVGASGFVEVPTDKITMGEPDLNETVYEYIQKDDFATARFDLSTVTIPENTPLEFGTAKQFFGAGTFTMKGVEIPLDVQAEITPTVNDEGLPRLNVTAQFSIRLLEPFEIEGPPGPDPANDTLEFFLTFPMKPVE